MSKYIITKSNIICEIDKEEFTKIENGQVGLGYCKTDFGGTCRMMLNKENIIKQADTIEELCDEFVITNELVKGYVLTSAIAKSSIKWDKLIENGFLKVQKVYGAIWTDKGLIYVAKLNNEGKLELIK